MIVKCNIPKATDLKLLCPGKLQHVCAEVRQGMENIFFKSSYAKSNQIGLQPANNHYAQYGQNAPAIVHSHPGIDHFHLFMDLFSWMDGIESKSNQWVL
jgi:hypothetical protein